MERASSEPILSRINQSGKNLEVTSHEDGGRETTEGDGEYKTRMRKSTMPISELVEILISHII
jgi:hypothetical protein